MDDISFAARCSPESFGGKTFFENLFKIGLIKKQCPVCGRETEVEMYKSRNFIPLAVCPEHGKRSCLGAGFFVQENIKEPASFINYVRMYTRRMHRSDIQFLGGFSNYTMKFGDIVETAMIRTINDMIQNGDFKLGGNGKVVEVDEMCLSPAKYGRGRRPDQEFWILGLVEVDAPVVTVVNTSVRFAVRAEAQRKDAVRQRKRVSRRRAMVRAFVDSAFAVTPDQMEVEELDGDDQVTVRPTGPSAETNQRPVVNEFLKALNDLFKQSNDGQPRRALFFPLPDLSAATLERLIVANVKPESMIFTDEWPSYSCLSDLGFKHYTVCHKTEFSHFYEEGVRVIRASTNHIERLWLEVRRTTAHMTVQRTLGVLNLETYRQLKFYDAQGYGNVVRLLQDIAALWQ